MEKKPKIIAVVGPTASGKSTLAEVLAERLDGEVISCDSMQVYRGMDIGTAKPTLADRARVPYHLLDVAEPSQDFSAVDYAKAAEQAVSDILSRGRLPVFCGGTGLYLDAFLRGMPASPGGDEALRLKLTAEAERYGALYLHNRLAAVDPDAAAAIPAGNLRRVIRALEMYELTGVTKTEWDRRSREQPLQYDATVIYLTYTDRQLLYRRIEERVDAMLAEGLVAEAAALDARGVFALSRTAAAAIGYKEILPHLRGECTLGEAADALKQATRRYAKRQITWFSAKDYAVPLVMDVDGKLRNFEEIVNNALDIISNPR